MRVDIQRLDDRIRKLQEVRRMLADPEMGAILMEFLMTDDEHRSPAIAVESENSAPLMPSDEAAELVKGVVRGGDAQPRGLFRRSALSAG